MNNVLNIVHFSTADNEGGSGRAAYRIHSGLRRLGHVSRMLVGQKSTEDNDVETVHGGGPGRLADRLAEETTRRLGLQYLFYPSERRIRRHPWLADPSIIQLYNTHGGYFSHRLLPWLSNRAPVVWRLSDAWPVTGHCAYPGDCARWRIGCGSCPDLGAYPPMPFDTTAWLWRMKRRFYAQSRLTIVAPSSWTERIARESPLFSGATVHRIPNGLDLSLFQPMDRAAARTVLGIPHESRVILFSANVVVDNPRKGSHTLMEALRRLGSDQYIRVVLVGAGGEGWANKIPQQTLALGLLRDDRTIAAAYAAADIVAVPSADENMPNTAIEAMACGRPVVAADAGGMRDAVRDGETGILVPPRDADALARALRQLLDSAEMRASMGANGRADAEREFDADLQARRFEALYQSILYP